jgi:plastocyanin
MRRRSLVPALLLLSAACAAPSGGGGGGGAAPPNTVGMTDTLKFAPASITVAFRNTTPIPHTVTDDPGKPTNPADASLPAGAQPWDSGNLDPGQTYTYTFNTPGEYHYFCVPHEVAGMVGTITVTP